MANLCRQSGIDVFIGENNLEKIISFAPDLVHIHRAGGMSARENALLSTLKNKTKCRILETNVFGLADFSSNRIDMHAHVSLWDLWRWRRWLWPLHPPGIYLPYCLDTDAFRPTPSKFRAENKIPDDAFLIGRIGKTDWDALENTLACAMEKNQSIWLATVNDYSAKENDSFFQKFANRIVTVPRLGSANKLSQFYSACDITMNFSPIGESFGYCVAESMACGTPVVVLSKPRNDNAQIELAASEHGGFPVDGPRSAATVIETLATNRARLEAAREKCRRSIECRYSTHVLRPQILKAYELLVSTRIKGEPLERLFKDNGFITHYPEMEIRRLLLAVHGCLPSRFERIKMQLAYSLPNAIRQHCKFLQS